MGRKVSSTARRRKGAVRAKSFGKSAAKLNFIFNESANDESKAQSIRLWNHFIPISPSLAAKILSRGLPEESCIVLKIDDEGQGEIYISAEGIFSDDGSFDLEEKVLDAGLIRVEDGHMGLGIGRTAFRNQIEFFFACGVKKFEVNATLDNGGYTWARLGFLPNEVDDGELDSGVATPARKTIDALGTLLKKDEKKRLKELLKFKEREDLWRVADADIDIAPRLKTLFNQAASRRTPENQKIRARATISRLKEHFSENMFSYMKRRAKTGESVMVGRLLLTGTSWDGYIDMDDPKQMERVGEYTGGWKYLKIG